MRSLYLLCVGKLKEQGHLQLEADYLKRLNPKLRLIETRAQDDQKELEAQELLKKIKEVEEKSGRALVVLLSERGKLRSTLEFHQWLEDILLPQGSLIFIIGGSAGHGESIIERADQELSLSPLTFPHKLARLLLIEQLYRAQTLRQGHPYHK